MRTRNNTFLTLLVLALLLGVALCNAYKYSFASSIQPDYYYYYRIPETYDSAHILVTCSTYQRCNVMTMKPDQFTKYQSGSTAAVIDRKINTYATSFSTSMIKQNGGLVVVIENPSVSLSVSFTFEIELTNYTPGSPGSVIGGAVGGIIGLLGCCCCAFIYTLICCSLFKKKSNSAFTTYAQFNEGVIPMPDTTAYTSASFNNSQQVYYHPSQQPVGVFVQTSSPQLMAPGYEYVPPSIQTQVVVEPQPTVQLQFQPTAMSTYSPPIVQSGAI